jgi:hypothetical protein
MMAALTVRMHPMADTDKTPAMLLDELARLNPQQRREVAVLVRSAPVRSAPLRSASLRSAPRSFAPARFHPAQIDLPKVRITQRHGAQVCT